MSHEMDSDDFAENPAGPSEPFHVVPSSSSTSFSVDNDRHRSPPELTVSQISEKDQNERSWHQSPWISKFKRVSMPVLETLFSPRNQRTVVKTTLIGVAITWMFLTSFFAYVMFYRWLVPRTTHIEPVWFQYHTSSSPSYIVDLSRENTITNPLCHDQHYDISIRLHMPTSDINFSLGNFMVMVELQTADGTIIERSSRPAILRYQSSAQRILRVFVKALPLLVGITEESQVVHVSLLEGFVEKKATPVTKVRVFISDTRVQVYDADLLIYADLRGLRYYMYTYRIITSITFIGLFAIIEMTFGTLAWILIGQKVWTAVCQENKHGKVVATTTHQDQQRSPTLHHSHVPEHEESDNGEGSVLDAF